MNFQPRSCASCDEAACDLHQRLRALEIPEDRVTWVLDDVWPEIASVVKASFGPRDQLVAPGIFGAPPVRYRWPVATQHEAAVATLRRHWAMWRVAKASGAVRQSSYLRHDRLLARRLARHIDYRARHLVLAQNWLPWLHETGALGGRTFDVVMSRYPFLEIHRLLNLAASEIGPSATIADFRAPADLVDRETELLARAERIYTPHHGIAALFPRKAIHLAWHKPPAKPHKVGDRIAFLGPTISRQRPDIVRRLVAGIREPIIVFGPVLESLLDGLPIERRERGPNWLDGIGTILHPATLTHEPRALLEARANGVIVYATDTCGLDPSDYRPLDRFPRS